MASEPRTKKGKTEHTHPFWSESSKEGHTVSGTSVAEDPKSKVASETAIKDNIYIYIYIYIYIFAGPLAQGVLDYSR